MDDLIIVGLGLVVVSGVFLVLAYPWKTSSSEMIQYATCDLCKEKYISEELSLMAKTFEGNMMVCKNCRPRTIVEGWYLNAPDCTKSCNHLSVDACKICDLTQHAQSW